MNPTPRRPRIEQHRAMVERVESVVVQDTWVKGRIQVDGVGEFFLDVKFASTFCEKPYLFPGAVELDSGSPESGKFPDVAMTVSGWVTQTPTNGGPMLYYTGASLAIRVSGRSGQRAWLTYGFTGKALSSLNVQ